MDTLISRFTEQLEEALQIADAANIRQPETNINKAYVAGLGGSGIGADFVADFIRDEAKIPYLVGKGYDIPSYVDKNTLAIVSSYSGNTEETVGQYNQLLDTGAKIVVISSGGKLIEAAKKNDNDYIQVPDSWPSPRACLGFSVVTQLGLLTKLGFITPNILKAVASSTRLINKESGNIKTVAKGIAHFLFEKLPILYSSDRMPAVTVRLRQQINENAKKLCWHHIIPEMNHNELVGWKDEVPEFAVLYLRSEDDHIRNATRMDIMSKIIKEKTPHVMDVYAKGNGLVEQAFYLVHLGDWVSWHLSQMRNQDAIEVDAIDYLKGELAKV